MKIEELIQHLPKKARFVSMGVSYVVWYVNRPHYLDKFDSYSLCLPYGDYGLVQIEIKPWADSIKDSLIELPEPVPELKRGDKVRFRTNETCKWRYGFCTGHQHDKPLAKIAGGDYDGVWEECEPFEWTDDDLRKFALGDEE